jgi:hypothetical protein
VTSSESFEEFDASLESIHTEPFAAATGAAAPFTAAQMEAIGVAITDGILAQVLFAVANISIFGVQPFIGLQTWANALEGDASTALSTATGANTKAQGVIDGTVNVVTGGTSTNNSLTTFFTQLQGALTSLLPSIFGNSDGTATPQSGSTVTAHSDGTATWTAAWDSLLSLFSNNDGTAVPAATALQNVLGSAGTTQSSVGTLNTGLTGILPEATSRGDGTALALFNIFGNGDGTASTATGTSSGATSLADSQDGTAKSIESILKSVLGGTGTHQALINSVVAGSTGVSSASKQTPTDAYNALVALFTNTSGASSNAQSLINSIVNFFTGSSGTQSSSAVTGSLQGSLGGLIPGALANGDGTAALTTSAVTVNTDGTASFGSIFGSSPLLGGLIDAVDGTVQSVYSYLQNLLGGTGTHQALANSIVAGATGASSAASVTPSGVLNALTGVYSTATTGAANAQGVIDAAVQALTGSTATGNTALAAGTNLQAIPAANITPTPNASASGAPMFGASGTGWTPTTGSASSLSTSGSHTIAAGDNFVAVPVLWAASVGSVPTVTYGTASMSALTSGEYLGSSASGWTMQWFGLYSPPSGPQTVIATVEGFGIGGGNVTCVAAYSNSYSGVLAARGQSGANGAASNPAQSVTSAANDLVIQAFGVINTGSITLGSYNQTQRYNSGTIASSTDDAVLLVGDAPGSGTVSFSATASTTSGEQWGAVAINLVGVGTAPIGSGFRQYRTLTATVTSTSGGALFPNSFFNTQDTCTSDITSAPATNNQITVANAGWYAVSVYAMITTAVVDQFFRGQLYKNGSLAKSMGPTVYPTSSSQAWMFGGSCQIYCNAGDTLQPGYYSSYAGTGVLTGETTGTECYWEVALLNRSLL